MAGRAERISRAREAREAVRGERGWEAEIERPQFGHEPEVVHIIDVVLQAP